MPCHSKLLFRFQIPELQQDNSLSHSNRPGTCDEGGLGVRPTRLNQKQNCPGPHCFVFSSIFIHFYLFYLFSICIFVMFMSWLCCFIAFSDRITLSFLHWNTVRKSGTFVLSEFKYIFRCLILSHGKGFSVFLMPLNPKFSTVQNGHCK